MGEVWKSLNAYERDNTGYDAGETDEWWYVDNSLAVRLHKHRGWERWSRPGGWGQFLGVENAEEAKAAAAVIIRMGG